MKIDELEKIRKRISGKLIQLSHNAQTPHLGSALSSAHILTALYWEILNIDPKRPEDENRDRFILSKGHAATVLYTALAFRGFFPEKLLDTFADPGSKLAEQPSPRCVPGVEEATGSLGHGLSTGIGMAIAARILGKSHRVFVLMSDGECEEGTVWEAAMTAPARGIDRLAVIIDYNKWQATGRSNEIMSLDSLADKWKAFNWSVREVDGHSFEQILGALKSVPDGSGKPLAVIAHTVKGKGISFMEDDNNWHYRSPNADEVKKAFAELGLS